MLIPIITAHSAQPGKLDEYEDFLVHRKLGFIRRLSSVKRYDVYRRGDIFGQFDAGADAPKYSFCALIEVDDLEKARQEMGSPEFEAFRREYLPLLVHGSGVYAARKIEQTAVMSSEEYKEHRARAALRAQAAD